MIPADTYKNNGDTPTFTVGAQLLVNASLDDTLVYNVTRAMWHNTTQQRLRNGHPKGIEIEAQNALTGTNVPLHPGAERFYRESGLLPEIQTRP